MGGAIATLTALRTALWKEQTGVYRFDDVVPLAAVIPGAQPTLYLQEIPYWQEQPARVQALAQARSHCQKFLALLKPGANLSFLPDTLGLSLIDTGWGRIVEEKQDGSEETSDVLLVFALALLRGRAPQTAGPTAQALLTLCPPHRQLPRPPTLTPQRAVFLGSAPSSHAALWDTAVAALGSIAPPAGAQAVVVARTPGEISPRAQPGAAAASHVIYLSAAVVLTEYSARKEFALPCLAQGASHRPSTPHASSARSTYHFGAILLESTAREGITSRGFSLVKFQRPGRHPDDAKRLYTSPGAPSTRDSPTGIGGVLLQGVAQRAITAGKHGTGDMGTPGDDTFEKWLQKPTSPATVQFSIRQSAPRHPARKARVVLAANGGTLSPEPAPLTSCLPTYGAAETRRIQPSLPPARGRQVPASLAQEARRGPADNAGQALAANGVGFPFPTHLPLPVPSDATLQARSPVSSVDYDAVRYWALERIPFGAPVKTAAIQQPALADSLSALTVTGMDEQRRYGPSESLRALRPVCPHAL